MTLMNGITKSLIGGLSLISITILVWSRVSERSIPWDEDTANREFNSYVLQSTSLPVNSRFNPTIANGFLGHAIYSQNIYMNGLYNGEKGDSHRARISGTLPYVDVMNVTLKFSNSSVKLHFAVRQLYSMDMQAGCFTQMFELVSLKDGAHLCSLHQRFYAHRYLTRILVSDILIECVPDVIITIPLKDSHGTNSDDVIILKSGRILIGGKNFTLTCGCTKVPEQPGMQSSNVCYAVPDFPKELILRAQYGDNRTKLTYISSISVDKNDVLKYLDIAERLIAGEALLKTHEREWMKSWASGNIQIESSNKVFDSSVVSGLYYLLSAFPPISMPKYPYEFFGASPGGLTNGGENQDYWGHVFWDQDFWMLPALLPLFPDAVEYGLRYRIARLQSAMEKAKSFGFQGAFYPWESAYTGHDVCPGEIYVNYEQHVTGDIIHVLKQYIYLTGKWDFMHETVPCFPRSPNCYFTAWDMTYQTAKFWFSRYIFNKTTMLYEIENVMGPDEYYAPINNSAFTNIVASQNLKFAAEAAGVLHIDLPEKEAFLHVANNVFIPFNTQMNFHPEFDGFKPYYDIVKQADTIMLGFPLGYNMSCKTRDNDLNIYSFVTDPSGPAMTWSMFSINFNEREKYVDADEYFLKQFDNIQDPFQIWSESSNGGGAVNFLTGIGGYLQSILYGYLQLRIYDSYVTIKPRLPPTQTTEQVDKMVIHGLKIRGISIDVIVTNEHYSINISSSIKRYNVLNVRADKLYYLINVNDGVTLPASVLCYISVS